MPLQAVMPNRFQGRLSNWVGTRLTMGTGLTSGGANAYGSYATCITAAAYETFLMEIIVTASNTASAARLGAVTIGVDQAGGTSYTDVIPNLCATSAVSVQSFLGIGYRFLFPLYVPAGASVGAKYTAGTATQSATVGVTTWGQPTAPEQLRCGTYVDSLGFTLATSLGTTVTPGTASQGTWTSLGALPRAAWWFQGGYQFNDSSVTAANEVRVDFGVGASITDLAIVVESDSYSYLTANEQYSVLRYQPNPPVLPSPAGQNVYCRAWAGGGTPESGGNAIAYALGG